MACPRCERSLSESHVVTKHALLSCDGCGGCLVEERVLGDIADLLLSEAHIEVPGDFSDPSRARHDAERVLACPTCLAPMAKKLAFEVPVDRCPAHGIWLDLGELQAMLTNAEARTLACPSCSSIMVAERIGDAVVARCQSCAARWLTANQCRAVFGAPLVKPAGAGSRWFGTDSCPQCPARLERTVIGDTALFMCGHHGALWPGDLSRT